MVLAVSTLYLETSYVFDYYYSKNPIGATAVNKRVSHRVFADLLKDHARPTKFSSAGQFWGIAPGTPPHIVCDRFANIEATLKQAFQYMNTRGVNAPYKAKDRMLCKCQDIERYLEFHEAMKQNSASQRN